MTVILTENEINSEAEIVKEAQKDPKAFSPLYKKYYPDIFRYIYSKTTEEEAAADLTSQVFLKSLLHLHKWKNEGVPFSAWLYRIALNECHDYFRSTKKIQYVVLDEKAQSKIKEDVKLNIDEDKYYLLENFLQKLSVKDMQIIELRYFEKFSFKDIGYLMGITENNAKVKVYRILNKIRKQVKNEI